MNKANWLIQIYQLSDLTAQQSAAHTLSDIPGLTIEKRSCERGAFLIVESADADCALGLYELVMMADPHAELMHSTTGQDKSDLVGA